MRMIDADALCEYWLETGQNERVYDTNDFLYSIDEQETIDAEPVRHGRWERNKDCPTYDQGLYCINYYDCSECGEAISDRYGLYKFCPNCGAKMRCDNEPDKEE